MTTNREPPGAPVDVQEFGARNGIPNFAAVTWQAGWCAGQRAAQACDIEITSEMAAAGYAVLVSELPEPMFDLEPASGARIAIAVYAAMIAARPKPGQEKP